MQAPHIVTLWDMFDVEIRNSNETISNSAASTAPLITWLTHNNRIIFLLMTPRVRVYILVYSAGLRSSETHATEPDKDAQSK